MKSQYIKDTLDKFHEEILKWDLFRDIIGVEEVNGNTESQVLTQNKNSFYSPEEYSYYQKQCINSELKSVSSKNAQRILPYKQDSTRTGYQLIHCSLVNKFFVFELNQVPVKDLKQKAPLMNQGDFVILFRQDTQTLENSHIMGVIDSVNNNGALLLINTFIDMSATDLKAHNLGQIITEHSVWSLQKVSSLMNFNKAYLAAQSFSENLIQDCILDPLNSLQTPQHSDTYKLTKPQLDLLSKDFDTEELKVIQGCLRKSGLSVVDGDFRSGKTTAAVGLIKAFLTTSTYIKEQEELKLKNKKVKRYSIKELMENDSSDDEGYQQSKKKITESKQFPWFNKGYKHIADQLDFTQQEKVQTIMGEDYPTSETTDRKIVMKTIEPTEVPLPQKIMVVSPNSFTVDQLLAKTADSLGPSIKLLRLGHSLTDNILNKMYSIDHLSGSINLKERNDQVDEAKRQLVDSCQVLFISFQQLSTQVIDRSLQKFDTVIIDDASLIAESDVLQTLKHGANRLVLFGNRNIEQSQFQLHPRPDRTLFQRLLRALAPQPHLIETLKKSYSERKMLNVPMEPIPPVPVGKASSKRSTSKKSAAKEEVKASVQLPYAPLEIHFIDLSTSEEKEQKDSFINEEEAQSIMDYVKAHHDSLFANDQTCAITTPYRPQSLLLKNTLTEREDIDQALKNRLTNSEIGAFDDFMSRQFDTIIVSLCKTKNITKLGGPLLNNPLNIDYLKSRATKKLIFIGKVRGLNALWRHGVLEPAKEQGHFTEI